MKFNIARGIEILERTPVVLRDLLQGLDASWVGSNEGPGTWSPFDIVGHYIHGEKTDWIPRLQLILSDNPDKHFVPFDRFAQFESSKGKTLGDLLDEFTTRRNENVAVLRSLSLTETDLAKKGIHPAFGEVTVAQLLSTWVVHDLNHLAQISRVMARQYYKDLGPWTAYLRILQW